MIKDRDCGVGGEGEIFTKGNKMLGSQATKEIFIDGELKVWCHSHTCKTQEQRKNKDPYPYEVGPSRRRLIMGTQ